MDKPESTRAFLQELNTFLGTLHSIDATEVEWEKGEYGFKVSLSFSKKPSIKSIPPTNGKNELAVEIVHVVSPVVGVFHFMQKDFRPGSLVKAKEVLGLVKSVNVEHKIEPETGGKLAEIHVQDGQPVEYGQLLFSLEALRVS